MYLNYSRASVENSIVLSWDAHCNKPLHVLKNTDQCLRRKSLEFFPNSESQLSGQVPWKRRFLNEEAEPEILIDQPIVKKLPPCCMACNPVLLKILMSQFIIAENMKNVPVRTILRHVDTDSSVCCNSCLRDNWGSSSILPWTVSIFSSVRTLGFR
jgi:hypothetical protein